MSQEEPTPRSRGGFRSINTIPENISQVRAPQDPKTGQPIELLCNFIRVNPMPAREIIQYRVDYEPNIESTKLRRFLFNKVREEVFREGADFDGMHDVMCSYKTHSSTVVKELQNPSDETTVTLTIKQVGTITWVSDQMVRVYNMNMKGLLRALNFFQVNKLGAYVHPNLSKPIGNSISMIGGFKTACNVHEEGTILMNLESVHKLMQRNNVLQYMSELKDRGAPLHAIKEQLVGKLVVTAYNKEIYKVEDVNFDISPQATFKDHRSGNDISYIEYYEKRYKIKIRVPSQPLLLGVPNTRKRRPGEEDKEIYLVPELCNIAGLTDQQRNDNRLKTDLIRASQVSPQERVDNIKKFLTDLHNSQKVNDILGKWAYTIDKEPVNLKGRILPLQKIGVGKYINQPHTSWPEVDSQGGFDGLIMRENLACIPELKRMYILMSSTDARNENVIIDKLKRGFQKIGLVPSDVKRDVMEGDSAHMYVNYLKKIPSSVTAIVVIIPHQNKERYDAIKKLCAVERGLVTQVVTSKLMMDERKSGGAATKIAIQIAAKIGGEPWYNHIPLQAMMVCGYDTYHDTAKRGRSFGAFLASMNQQRSRWWSKADSHEHLDELSTHVADNMTQAMHKFKEANEGRWPERVFLYRDGVGDGQIQHVFEVELEQIKRAIFACNEACKLTFIIVNKRVGARFFMRNNQTFINPPPGSVVDDVVTRKSRYDFYLVSQSTRHGSVAPTYYNIIYDTSGLEPYIHQLMAFKMCFLYYNWTGTVRVPAPCQYAHKLALLCGEHLHAVPNSALDDRLHFL